METVDVPQGHVTFEKPGSGQLGVDLVFSDEILNILDLEPGDEVGVEVVVVDGRVSFRLNFDDLSLSEEEIESLSEL